LEFPSKISRNDVSGRILIVDDHEVVRQGVRSVLEYSRPGWEICGEAADGNQAIEAAQALQPDVVILDITMPKMSGLEAASRIAKLSSNSRILIFTMHESERIDSDVRAVGAHGYVQKSQAGRDLVAAIDSLLAGGTFFGGKSQAKATKSGKPIPGLSMCQALCCNWKKATAGS
jgi:DNA-binding NarL/FixJ family response regulator